MKKFFIITNICLCIMFICSTYFLIVEAIRLESAAAIFLDQPYDFIQKEYIPVIINSSILIFLSIISMASSIVLIIIFNYRFDGVSMREKVANRIAESKKKKAQYKAEKAEEEKQKQIAELQAKIDELKK